MSTDGYTQTYMPATLDGLNTIDADQIYLNGEEIKLDDYVPYTGATQMVDLGNETIRSTWFASNPADLVNKNVLDTTISNLTIAISGTFLDKLTSTQQNVVAFSNFTGGLGSTTIGMSNGLQFYKNNAFQHPWTITRRIGTASILKDLVFRDEENGVDTLLLSEDGQQVFVNLTCQYATPSKIPIFDSTRKLVSSGVDSSKIIYLDNCSEDIQTALNNRLKLDGSNANQNIVLGAYKVQSTATPTANSDYTTKLYVDNEISGAGSLYLLKTGGTMVGDIVMGSNKITSTANPLTDDTLSRKGYIDSQDALKADISYVNTQLALKANLIGPNTFSNTHTFTSPVPINLSGLTASRVLQLSSSGNVESSTITTTELGYLTGVSSGIQTQISARVLKTGDEMSGALQIKTTGFAPLTLTRTSALANYGVGSQHSLVSTGNFQAYYARAFGGSDGVVATTAQTQANGYYVLDVANAGVFGSDTAPGSSLVYINKDGTRFNGTVGIGIPTSGTYVDPLSRFTINANYASGQDGGFCINATDNNVYNLRLFPYVQAGSQVGYNFRVNNIASSSDALAIAHNGFIGLNTGNPLSRLDIQTATRSGTHGSGFALYATRDAGAYSDGIAEFRHTNGTQGIGIGFNGIYATGTNANQELQLASRGTGTINLLNPTVINARLQCNGNVGIGITNPGVKLHVVGDVSVDGQVNISGANVLQFGAGLTKEVNSGKVGYGWVSSSGLDIVGGGLTAGTRSVVCYDRLGVGMLPTENFQTAGNARFGGNIGVGLEPSGTRWLRVSRANTVDLDWSSMISFENPAVGAAYTNWEAGPNVFSGKSRFTIRGGTKNFNTLNNLFNLDSDGRATFLGLLGVSAGNGYAISNNYMTAGSLTIGDLSLNYGGGTNWTSNTAGLLMECLDNTEIAVHDAGNRVASFMYFQGAGVNTITIGRDMFWGATPLIVASRLQCNGNVGIGTTNPATALHIARSFSANADYSGMITFENTLSGYYEWQIGPQVLAGQALFSIRGGADGLGSITNMFNILPISSTVGYVGINTATPSAPLTVNGSITIKSVNGVYEAGCIYSDSNWGMLMRGAVAPLVAHFRWDSSAGAELMRLDTSGNLGIGITPRAKLDVEGDIITGWGNYRIGTQYLSSTSGYFLGLQTDANNRVLNLVSQAADATGSVRISTGTGPTERMRITASGSVGIGTNAPTGVLDVYNTAADYTNSVVIRTPWSSITLDNTQVAGGRKWALLSGGIGAGVGVGGFGLFDITAGAYRIGVSSSGTTSIYGETHLPGTPTVGSTRSPTYRLSLDNFSTTGRAIWAPLEFKPLYTTPFPSYGNWNGTQVFNAMSLPVACNILVSGFMTFYTDTVGQRFAYARLFHQATGVYYYPEFTKFFNITGSHEVVPIHQYFYGMPAGQYDLYMFVGGNVFVDVNDRAMIGITVFT